ncbi:hypothetical protein BDR22DRAFT_818861 [Usnea florida]
MSGTEKKPDFEMFRATLQKLERLIGVCTSHWTHHVTYTGQPSLHHAMQTTYGDAMIHTLKLLRDMNINTSESNAMEELKRLATISKKLLNKRGLEKHCDKKNANLNVRGLLNKLIDSKKAFLKNGAFSHLVKEGGVEPMTALERFLEVQMKHGEIDMEELLISRPLTKSVTPSSRKVADPVQTPQKQENPNRDLPGECKEPKTTATSASIPSSSLENQTEIQIQWLLNQNKVHEEWILKQIEAQTKLDVDSGLKDVNKVLKRLTQDQKKVNMEWLQHHNSAHMGWIRDQNKINMKWLQDPVEDHTKEGDVDSSEEDGGELTPTSTITSG